MKLFLDANVLFTAAYSPEGISSALFKLAAAGRCALVTSAYAEEEARRNLVFKAPNAVQAFNRLAGEIAIVKEPSPSTLSHLSKLPLADKDTPILGAAAESHATILVTGDRRDFGHLFGRTVEGVRVLSPADSLAAVLMSRPIEREGVVK